MTTPEIAGALAAAASEVLETMFFAELSGDAAVPESGIHVRLEFRGERNGAFHLAASPALARTFASCFLAVDESEVTARQSGEVVCEMANMICGSVLSRVEPDAHYELLEPVLVEPAAAGECARGFLCDGEALGLWIDFLS